jgi:hypothetical protein
MPKFYIRSIYTELREKEVSFTAKLLAADADGWTAYI